MLMQDFFSKYYVRSYNNSFSYLHVVKKTDTIKIAKENRSVISCVKTKSFSPNVPCKKNRQSNIKANIIVSLIPMTCSITLER